MEGRFRPTGWRSPQLSAATATATSTSTPTPTDTPTPTPVPLVLTTTTIDYTYDPLYRLIGADYDSGEFFHYAYDAVGNRLMQDTHLASNVYTYDEANRLTSVDGVAYARDANGNLRSDGSRTYTYDHANRLSSVVQGPNSYEFNYNGLGDRLRQTVNTVATDYTLDLEGGLTQVLSDGGTYFLYGEQRVAVEQVGEWAYYLGDALGSARQQVDATSHILSSLEYEPFGGQLKGSGSAVSMYGFAGEWRDESGLILLRARYLHPDLGQFVSRDSRSLDAEHPESAHLWMYANANPVNLTDPTGFCPLALPKEDYKDCTEYQRLKAQRQYEEDLAYLQARRANPLRYLPSEPLPRITWSPSVAVEPANIVGPHYGYDIPAGEPVPPGSIASQNVVGRNSCGVVTINAIVGTRLDGYITANDFYKLVKGIIPSVGEGLTPKQLVVATNELVPFFYAVAYLSRELYPGELPYEDSMKYVQGLETADVGFAYLRQMMSGGKYPIAGVNVSGANGYIGRGNVYHWVAVTGLSAQWASGDDWRWVRVHNPFNNIEEYYPADFFHKNWNYSGATTNRHLVVLTYAPPMPKLYLA